jgi:hypothetical protein
MNHLQEMLPNELKDFLINKDVVNDTDGQDEKRLAIEELEARSYLKGRQEGIADLKQEIAEL